MLQADLCFSVPFLDQIRFGNRLKDFLFLVCHLRVASTDVGHPLRCQSYWNI